MGFNIYGIIGLTGWFLLLGFWGIHNIRRNRRMKGLYEEAKKFIEEAKDGRQL